MKGGYLSRSAIVKWLQDTPRLRTCEIAALAGKPMKYISERVRLMEIDGFIVRSEPLKIGGRTFITWNAADPQPTSKRKAPVYRKSRAASAKPQPIKSRPYSGQIIVVRPAPPRDVVVVGQALAQLPDLDVAWRMGMRR